MGESDSSASLLSKPLYPFAKGLKKIVLLPVKAMVVGVDEAQLFRLARCREELLADRQGNVLVTASVDDDEWKRAHSRHIVGAPETRFFGSRLVR